MALDLECLTTEYFTGDGVKTAYNLSFDFIDVADINVAWYSSVGSEYTTLPSTDTTYGYQVDTGANGSFIRFNNAPANNQKFFVYRLTSIDPLKADFEAGHPIKAQDLDDNFKQLANAIEDTRCIVEGIVDNELVDPSDIYWKKAGETVYSNNDWASSDCYVASTKAIEQRFSTLVHMDPNPPTGTNYDGQLWWDTDDGNLYVYYSDSDSNQWVEANVTTGEAPSDGLIYGRKDGNWSVVPVWQSGYVSDVPSATGLSYFRTSGAVAGDAGTWTATNVYSTADATKLAGIETGATADQTGSEIKTAYEAEADTNAFDDAAVTKLAGIATGAQVNDPNTVVDANYVATDENFTTADHAKLDGIETAATADQTGTEILTAIKTVDGTGSGLDADLLDGQEGSYYLDYNNLSNAPSGGLWSSSGSDVYYNSGNVGIGTTSPSVKLEVDGGSNATNIYVKSSASSTYLRFGNNVNILGYVGYESDQLSFYANNQRNYQLKADGTHIWSLGTAEHMRIDSSGNVGIGTTSPNSYPGYTTLTLNGTTGGEVDFESNGNLRGQIYGSTAAFNVDANGSSIPLRFRVNNAERMRIDSSGKVGIGSTDPSGDG